MLKAQDSAGNRNTADMLGTAESGVRGGGARLPHLDAIQASFGSHDVSGVRAFVGGAATRANESMGSLGYSVGDAVAFKGTPDLATASHEAAHAVQQRGDVQLKGGVGQVGDVYEQHADAVAAKVVAGESAQALLDQVAPSTSSAVVGRAVQHKKDPEQDQEAGGGGGGLGAAVFESTVQNLAEDIIKEGFPPAKWAILAGKLGMAFADGVGAAMWDARARLLSKYARVSQLSDEELGEINQATGRANLQDIREWQKDAVDELPGILREGLSEAVEKGVELALEEAVGVAVSGPLNAFGDKLGDMVGDLCTGDYVDFVDFMGQAGEDVVQRTVREVTEAVGGAFSTAAATEMYGQGMTELETRAALETDAGYTPDDADALAATHAATSMPLEILGYDVNQKIEILRDRMDEGWHEDFGEYREAYSKLSGHLGAINAMGTAHRVVSDKDEEHAAYIAKYAYDAWTALNRVQKFFMPRNTAISFEPDVERLRKAVTDWRRVAGDKAVD